MKLASPAGHSWASWKPEKSPECIAGKQEATLLSMPAGQISGFGRQQFIALDPF